MREHIWTDVLMLPPTIFSFNKRVAANRVERARDDHVDAGSGEKARHHGVVEGQSRVQQLRDGGNRLKVFHLDLRPYEEAAGELPHDVLQANLPRGLLYQGLRQNGIDNGKYSVVCRVGQRAVVVNSKNNDGTGAGVGGGETKSCDSERTSMVPVCTSVRFGMLVTRSHALMAALCVITSGTMSLSQRLRSKYIKI